MPDGMEFVHCKLSVSMKVQHNTTDIGNVSFTREREKMQ